MRPRVNLRGHRFGLLTVIEQDGRNKHKQFQWRCQCDCGKKVTVTGYNLRTGNTKSCGCLRQESKACQSEKPAFLK